jgi:hypothetical protein
MSLFAVIDSASHNVLGEYPELSQANALVERLVDADPSVSRDLYVREVAGAEAPEAASAVAVG